MDIAALVAEHYEYVLNLINKFTRNREAAEDILQDSAIKAIRSRGPDNPKLFRAWFVRIAINTAKNIYRRKDHSRHRVDAELDNFADESTSAEASTIDSDLRRFADKLPPRQRVAFKLRMNDGLHFKDIAEIMNCPYDTAKANYRHAVLKFRHFVGTGRILRKE